MAGIGLVRLRPRAASLLLASLSLAIVLATSLVIHATVQWGTTYAAASKVLGVADLAAGIALVGAGLLLCLAHGNERIGLLVLATGAAWLAHDWVGWQESPVIVRSAAMILAPLFVPLAFHVLVISAAAPQRPRRQDRAAVGILYVLAAAVSLGLALFADPAVDPNCWSNCTDNAFLASSQPSLAQVLSHLWVVTTIGAGLAFTAVGTRRLHTGTRTARRLLWIVLVAGILLGLAISAHGIVLVRTPVEDPTEPVFSAIFLAQGWATAMLAAGLAWGVLRVGRARAAVANLAMDLGAGPPPGALSIALGRATADPSLEVAYWLPTSGRFVDALGKTVVLLDAGSGRAVTQIRLDNQLVAVAIHDPAALDPDRLQHEIGPAARLAIDNERLQAEVFAQLQDLRASRVRIVEAGDAERRRLERNLHDGAQQRLIALSYDVRLASAAARAPEGNAVMPLLEAAGEEIQAAMEELRELAHGIYPAILTEAGLGPAIWAMSETASIPVQVTETPDQRFPAIVERCAYLVVAGGIELAARDPRADLTVCVAQDGPNLVVELRGVGRTRFERLTDRVAVLGGRIVNDGSLLRAEIPCA